MKALPLRPFPVPYESLSDYVARLAGLNGYHSQELWNILIRDGERHIDALENALGGRPLPLFSGPGIPNVEIPVATYGLRSSDFTRLYPRWCAHCLRQCAWLRPEWRLKVATVCHLHSVRLLQTCPYCGMRPQIDNIFAGRCECGANFSRRMRSASEVQVHLAKALTDSMRGSAVLSLDDICEEFTTSELVRLIRYLGRLVDGELTRPGQIQECEDLNVASQLFDGTVRLFSDWPTVFWECLDRHLEKSRYETSVRKTFGTLYRVLYKDLSDPAFQFIRNAFELFLLEHWRGELCGRHRLFNQETIAGRRHHSLTTVARDNHLGRGVLKRMVERGLMPANHLKTTSRRKFITIDETRLIEFIPPPGAYLNLRQVSSALGLKRTRIRELVAQGLVMADVRPNVEGENKWKFRRVEIAKLLAAFTTASLKRKPSGTKITLDHALRYWRISSSELYALLRDAIDAKIPFHLASKSLLRDITFTEEGLQSWLAAKRASKISWVSATTAATTLRLKEEVVYELVAKNLIDATLIPAKGRIFKRISQSSLLRFKEDYVSLAELAKAQGTSSNTLLKRIGATPITGPQIDGGRQYFFRRLDLL